MTAWWVLPDGRYLALSSGADLLTDVAIDIEDLRRACAELEKTRVESRRATSESRRARLRRSSTLQLVRDNTA